MSSNIEIPSAADSVEAALREQGYTDEDIKSVCEAQGLTHKELLNLLRRILEESVQTIGNGPNLPENIVNI